MEENWLNSEYVEYYNKNYDTSLGEFASYLDLMELQPHDSLIDFGCGNGRFLQVASSITNKLTGVDISAAQIDQARLVCPNADFHCIPFTDFFPGSRKFTKGFSRKALHHLSDPDKSLWLKHVGPSFSTGAVLVIEDGIFFEFEREELDKNWDRLLEQAAAYYQESWPAKEHDLRVSFRNEYPTGIGYWGNLLRENGFTLVRVEPKSSFYGLIMAVKL